MLGVLPSSEPLDWKRGRYTYFFIGGGGMHFALGEPDKDYKYRILQLNNQFQRTYQVMISVENKRFSLYLDGKKQGETQILPFSEQYFWIGYQAWEGAKIDATIQNLCFAADEFNTCQ